MGSVTGGFSQLYTPKPRRPRITINSSEHIGSHTLRIKSHLGRAALAACIILTPACRGKHHRTAVQNEEPQDTAQHGVASTFKMNDMSAQPQLVKGVYGIEGGTWRWAAGHFSIQLRTPTSSAQHGATLSLALTVPDVIIQKLGAVTLTASAGGAKLKSETYAKAGAYTFGADVPGSALGNDTVTLDFETDKSIPPSATDSRELALIVSAISLESK